MDLFGNNYFRLRNSSIIPLIPYGIKRAKVEHWSFKEVITNNILEFNKIDKATFEIELSKDEFYKALYCDIELFLNKTVIQYSNISKSHSGSGSWSFVTLYYFSFFTTTTLFRLLRSGFVYLNAKLIKRYTDYSLARYSSPIVLPVGNYYFSFKEESTNDTVTLTLKAQGSNLHQLSWIQLENTIRECIPFCDSDETVVYSTLLSWFNKFKSEFPSTMRNKFNYNGDSSIFDLDHSIPFFNVNNNSSELIKLMLGLPCEILDINQMQATAYLSDFLFKLVLKLHNDYCMRSRFGKDFSATRDDYLKLKGTSLLKL